MKNQFLSSSCCCCCCRSATAISSLWGSRWLYSQTFGRAQPKEIPGRKRQDDGTPLLPWMCWHQSEQPAAAPLSLPLSLTRPRRMEAANPALDSLKLAYLCLSLAATGLFDLWTGSTSQIKHQQQLIHATAVRPSGTWTVSPHWRPVRSSPPQSEQQATIRPSVT